MTEKPKNKGGRLPFTPTDEHRRTVRAMTAYGVPAEDVAKVVGVSPMTLRKYFRDELDKAHVEANAKVAERLFKKALDGDNACMIFWMKTRGGWREKAQQIEHSGRDGGPIETKTSGSGGPDLKKLTIDELRTLEALACKTSGSEEDSEGDGGEEFS